MKILDFDSILNFVKENGETIIALEPVIEKKNATFYIRKNGVRKKVAEFKNFKSNEEADEFLDHQLTYWQNYYADMINEENLLELYNSNDGTSFTFYKIFCEQAFPVEVTKKDKDTITLTFDGKTISFNMHKGHYNSHLINFYAVHTYATGMVTGFLSANLGINK